MRICVALIVGLVLSACGQGLSGTYFPTTKGSTYSKLEFVSGSEVDVTASLLGMVSTSRATYKVEKGKLVIAAGGQSVVFEIDDKGCFGNSLIGMFCKK